MIEGNPTEFRNPGPTWGYAFLWRMQQMLPRIVLRPLTMVGAAFAVWLMPVQRRHSRTYLAEVLGRCPRWHDVWRHFFAYTEFFFLRLRAADGVDTRCQLDPPHAQEFEALLQSGEPALFGTFHFGHSDLLGFLLAGRGRRIAMVRLRVANSSDIELLERQFGGAVSFIWVNDADSLLFAMKSALDRGDSLAMQCDRLFSSRIEPFEFLGARRMFPFAIYHLAILYGRPVAICLGLPNGNDTTRVESSPIFRPVAGASREQNLEAARSHFQAVLRRLETLVRQYPYHWFNFLPLNPVAVSVQGRLPATALSPTGPS